MSCSSLHRANAARSISAPSAPWESSPKHLGRRFFQVGNAPLWRGDSRRGATSTHTESREAEKSAPSFRGTDRSRPSSASPSARPGAAARPPRGLSRRTACPAPGGFPGCPTEVHAGGEWVAQVSSRGWRSESARALVLRGKGGSKRFYYRRLKNVAAP